MARNLERRRGVVQALNDTGINVEGTWYSFSRYGPHVTYRPILGETVDLVADERRFLVELTSATPPPDQIEREHAPAAAPAGAAPDRDRIAARASALQVASILLTPARPELEEVLAAAALLEAWLIRPVDR